MSIQSPCAIVLTPTVGAPVTLVAAGGWLTALPVLEASQGVFESDGVLLGNAFFRPLGNVAVTITFTTEEDHADLPAVLDAYLSADAGSVLEISGLLTIGTLAEFADAVVSVVTPDLPSGTGTATLTRVYTVQASIPTPPPS